MDQFQDSAEMAMFRGFVYADAEFQGADAAALDAIPLDGRTDGERFEGARDCCAVGAGVGKRCYEHVSGESGERVDVTDVHGYSSLEDGGWEF